MHCNRLIGVSLLFLFATLVSRNVSAQTADRGETVYTAQKCSVCHSLAGKGQAKGPLDDVGSKLTADEIRQWLVNPKEMSAKANATRKPVMPAYTKLSKEDLDSLVAFLAAKKKK
jgi:mono/diheme cytochrome c family protein